MNRGLLIIFLIHLGCDNRQVDFGQNDIFVKFKTSSLGQPINALTMPNSNSEIRYFNYQGNLYEVPTDYEKVPYQFMLTWMNPKVEERQWIHKGQIKILVDTLNSLDDRTYIDPPDNLPTGQIDNWIDSHRITVSTYPVYIINISNDVTSIEACDTQTTMIQEAKDENGNWRPIEYYMSGFCDLGHLDYVIPQNSFLIATAYKYKGDFTTDIRVKLTKSDTVYYSNSYRGQVNKSQFEMSDKLKKYDNWLRSLN